MFIVGIDLSGPSNTADTSLVVFRANGERLKLQQSLPGAGDGAIYDIVADLCSQDAVAIGIDAPLSYNPGGGDRPCDSDLRCIQAGMRPGSVMAPIMTRMAYLTLRGIYVARSLRLIQEAPPRIVEVHPGATMALRGAPIYAVKTFKQDAESRQNLLQWLAQQGLGAIANTTPSDHDVAACAAALTAWKWCTEETVWLHRATPPFHAFDYDY